MRLSPVNSDNKRLCSALNNIRVDASRDISDTGAMFNWLRGSLDAMRVRGDTLSGDQLIQNQGACQLLQEFLDSFEVAKSVLKKN